MNDMKTVFLISLFCVVSFALTPKAPTACIDPTFACQDLKTARLCGTVKDCITDIWATFSAPEDNNEICDLCKEMVEEARNQLLSNETQEEIKEVFEGSCALIPIEVIANECKKLVDEFIPELIEMLASRMDPNMVCTVAGLCNSEISKELSSADIISLFSKFKNNYCDDCKNIFNSVKQIFQKIPQNEMESMLVKACNQFPESDKCTVIIKSYLPLVYNFVTTMNAVDVCDMIGECNGQKTFNKVNKYQDNMTCEFCEAMVQHLRDLILTNTTKDEFKTALLNLCSLFKSFASECKELVNDYYDMLYDFLNQALNPQTLCTYLGLCSSSNKIEAKIIITPLIKMWNGKHPDREQSTQSSSTSSLNSILAVKIIPQYSTHQNKYNKESNDIKSVTNQLPLERLQHPMLSFKQDTECAFCKAVMFFLSKDISQRNEKSIKYSLDNVCTKWISGFSKECKSFVDRYYEKVVELLLLGVKFEEVCDHLNVCRPEKIIATRILAPLNSKNDIRCEICEKVMTYLEDELKDKTTEEKIRDVLDKVCTILPTSMLTQCKSFVDEYTDIIVSLIIQEVKPSDICSTIGLCSSVGRQVSVKNQFTCELCQDVMTYLKQLLNDPKTEDDIKQALDEVCTLLPQSLTKECEDFVDQYTNLIVSLILQEMDPDKICAEIGLCPKNNTLSKVEDPSVECKLCKDIMSALENELKDKSTEDEIRAALETVCSLLPGSYGKKCQDFIDKYTETIITLLVQNIKPNMICSLLNICPSENLECTLCQYFLHFLQNELMSNSTESEIKNLLEKVCSYLPKSLSTECSAFVSEYGDAIIVLLAQRIDPSVVCPLFKVCPGVQSVKNPKLDTCEVCEAAVNYIDQLLEDNTVEQELTDLTAKVCNLLSGSSKQECISIIELYGPSILKMIGNLDDNKQVCQSIDLCPRTKGLPHLIGAEKCTFGPSYWCKSSAHAAACKAEEFCRRKVWKN